MPNTLETTFNTRAVPALNRAFGVTVTIEREGRTASVTSRRHNRADDVIGARQMVPMSVTRRKFVFAKADYDFGSGAVAPLRGDRITEGSSVFEIVPPNNDQDAVEDTDYEWLVHTKRVSK